jgi:hypothetical protein
MLRHKNLKFLKKFIAHAQKVRDMYFQEKYLQWKPRDSRKDRELLKKTALIINRVQPNLHRLQRMHE